MLNSIHHKKPGRTSSLPRSLHITIAVVIAVLILAQFLLVYIVLSNRQAMPLEARPDICDRFEMKLPYRRGRCLPARYTPTNEA